MRYEILDSERGGKTLKIDGFYLHSKYNPEKEARDLLKYYFFNKNRSYVFFGCGLGYLIKEMIRQNPDFKNLFIYEPKRFFIDPKTFVHTNTEHNKIKFFEGELDDLFKAVCEIKNFSERNDVTFFLAPQYLKVFKKEFTEFYKKFKDYIETSAINKNTVRKLAPLWNKNTLMNIRSFIDGYNGAALNGVFKGRPAVVLGAGPSLSLSLSELKDAQNKLIIIATYTSLAVIKKAGIRADFVVTLDPNQIELETDAQKQTKFDEPLICYALSDPVVIDKHAGKKIFFTYPSENYAIHYLEKFGVKSEALFSGGSVAHAGMDLAARVLKCDPVILLGTDFSYAVENEKIKTHASGTFYDNINETHYAEGFFTVPAIGGGETVTTKVFAGFRKWVEEYVKRDKERRYVNAGKIGSIIEGVESFSFSELQTEIDKDFSVEKLFSDADRAKLLSDIKKDSKSLQNLIRYLNEAIDLSKSLRREPAKKTIKRLDELDKKITGEKSAINLINFAFQKTSLDSGELNDRAEEFKDDELILEKNVLIYEGAYEATRSALEIMNKIGLYG
jgi:hypothetical protein